MFKHYIKMTIFLLISATSLSCFADTVIENAPHCAMKNLDVACEKGDNIKLDVIRTNDQRGVVFLKVNTSENIGDHLLLYINNNKPEVLKIENGNVNLNSAAKGAFISRSIASKLKAATSVHFKIAMKKRKPIQGSLGSHHFEWLKQFGNICS